jgi:hypothetical protein
LAGFGYDFMTTFAQQIADAEAAIEVVKLFLLKYESKIPAGMGNIDVASKSFFVFLNGRSDNDRTRALTVMGDVFGRSGWSSTFDRYDASYNWSKTVDGVKLSIQSAQKPNQPDSFPVDPKQFPIQIEDAQ